jgi:hypothetical protein
MSQTSEIFEGLLANLKVDNTAAIGERRDGITKSLNKEFRGIAGSTDNKLMAGSYGRFTAIKGISDLDLLYILPKSLRSDYEKAGGASKALTRTRAAILARYSSTSVKVDRLVVVVEFSNFKFEVQPVFENDDESFSYPDTYTDSWKITKPRAEIQAMSTDDALAGGNLRRLCKFARAWKNKHGVAMGGLLIDTLAYNFLADNPDHRGAGSAKWDVMVRDFFEYLSEEEDHQHYAALGSRQRVKVKKQFQSAAAEAYDLCLTAIAAAGQKNAYKKWRAVFGNSVPVIDAVAVLAASAFVDTEQFIESFYPVDIRYDLSIDCTVTQDGFRPQGLRAVLSTLKLLPVKKQLTFTITATDAPAPYRVKWKVLNRGPEAERLNSIRGQIINSSVGNQRREVTSFRGSHLVECYIIHNGVVVARDSVIVPIAAETR